MPSSAACSFLAKASIGMLRDTGSTATFFRLMFPRARSACKGLCEKSSSVRTRDAIMRRSLIVRSVGRNTQGTELHTELLYAGSYVCVLAH